MSRVLSFFQSSLACTGYPKKVVLKLDLHDDKEKQRALKTITEITGIDSVAVDMKDKKMTVIGNIDPVRVVLKLEKKKWHVEILTVGPAKEEKKEAEKKEEPKKKDKKEDACPNCNYPYMNYRPSYYCVPLVEERPTGCIIL